MHVKLWRFDTFIRFSGIRLAFFFACLAARETKQGTDFKLWLVWRWLPWYHQRQFSIHQIIIIGLKNNLHAPLKRRCRAMHLWHACADVRRGNNCNLKIKLNHLKHTHFIIYSVNKDLTSWMFLRVRVLNSIRRLRGAVTHTWPSAHWRGRSIAHSTLAWTDKNRTPYHHVI